MSGPVRPPRRAEPRGPALRTGAPGPPAAGSASSGTGTDGGEEGTQGAATAVSQSAIAFRSPMPSAIGKPRESSAASSRSASRAAQLPSTSHGRPSGIPVCAGNQRGHGCSSSSRGAMPSARARARWLSASGTTPQCSHRHTFAPRGHRYAEHPRVVRDHPRQVLVAPAVPASHMGQWMRGRGGRTLSCHVTFVHSPGPHWTHPSHRAAPARDDQVFECQLCRVSHLSATGLPGRPGSESGSQTPATIRDYTETTGPVLS